MSAQQLATKKGGIKPPKVVEKISAPHVELQEIKVEEKAERVEEVKNTERSSAGNNKAIAEARVRNIMETVSKATLGKSKTGKAKWIKEPISKKYPFVKFINTGTGCFLALQMEDMRFPFKFSEGNIEKLNALFGHNLGFLKFAFEESLGYANSSAGSSIDINTDGIDEDAF